MIWVIDDTAFLAQSAPHVRLPPDITCFHPEDMGASARAVRQHRVAAEVVFMAWFRVDADLVDHPKVFRLAELLNEPSAGWYYVRLLAWTSRYAARGRVRDGARTAIEHACGWRGEPGALLRAFIQAGLVNGLEGQADGATLEVHNMETP